MEQVFPTQAYRHPARSQQHEVGLGMRQVRNIAFIARVDEDRRLDASGGD